jgi:hypothetical protein
VTLQYAVRVPAPGRNRFWARGGWFNARADFQWRLGDGAWQSVPRDHPTTNLMELGFFCEVSWADLGEVQLDQDTTLQIRHPKAAGDKARMLMAADCWAFIPGEFLPDGPFRPGQSYDGPQDRQTAPLVFGHRLIYRTKIQVPAAAAGRGFQLHFSGTNWIVSVFVNGRLAGTHTGVWVPWDLDVTPHVKPGQVNELAVAVKGTYYALDPAGMGDKSLNAARNRPLDRKEWSRWVAPMYPSTKGDGNG